MKRLFMSVTASLLFLNLSAQEVPLILKNPAGTENMSVPLTFGVPFSKGKVSANCSFTLKEANGTVLPLQTEVTGTWEDGSVKWLLCDSQAKLSGKADEKLALSYSRNGTRKTLQTSLSVKEVSSPHPAYEVNAGDTVFRIRRDRFNLIDAVFSGEIPILRNTEDSGLNIVNGKGKFFSSTFGAPDEVKLEENGPLRAVIRAEGWYYSADGEKFCRYIVRLHFFAGQPYVKILHTFIITEGIRGAKFRDISLRLSADIQNYSFGGTEAKSFTEKDGGAHLLQFESDKFILRKSSEKTEWTDKADGQRSPGWIEASSRNGKILLYVKDFWQEFPKEFEVDGKGALIFHEWPAHGVAKPDRKVENSMLQYLWFVHEGKTLDFEFPESYLKYRSPEYSEYEYRYFSSAADANCIGIAKTHEIHIAFGKKGQNGSLLEFLPMWRTPPVCMATPEYMCASGVFGRLHPYDPVRFGKVEEALSKVFDTELRLQDHTKDYGMFVYGDAHTCWDYRRGRWMDLYRTWRAFHHGAPRAPWILYVRSGDPKYLARGIVNARRLMDIGLCNYTTPELEGKPYPEGKILGALNDYKGIVPWHSGSRLMDYNYVTDFMLYYYYLTGDKRGLEVAEMWGNSVKKNFRKPFAHREGAGLTSSLIDLYCATHDEGLKKIIDKQVDFMFSAQQMKPGIAVNSEGTMLPHGAFPQWEDYAPWLEKYWEMTGDPRAAECFKAWADAYINGQGDSFSRYPGGMQINVPAYAYLLSRDRKYLLYGLRLMNSYLDGIENAPGTLLDGFPHTAQISLGSCYAAQRIPCFLAALSEYPGKLDDKMAYEELFVPLALPMKQVKVKEKIRIFEILLLKEKPGDFKIGLNIHNSYRNPVIDYAVYSPSGKAVIKKSEAFKPTIIKLNLSCPEDGELGVYKVVISSKGSFWEVMTPVLCTPAMKQALPFAADSMLDARNDGRYFFFVPDGVSEFKVTAVSSSNVSFFFVADPQGKVLAKVLAIPGRDGTAILKVPSTEAGKLWEIRGVFSGCRIIFEAKPKRIPGYLYCDKSWFFLPSSSH